MKLRATQVSLSGEITVTNEGVVTFENWANHEGEKVFAKGMSRKGNMNYRENGDLLFVPMQSLSRMPMAPQVETIFQNGGLRIEMSTRNFIVHVKLGIELEQLAAEDLLDEALENALKEIMKKKEEEACSML